MDFGPRLGSSRGCSKSLWKTSIVRKKRYETIIDVAYAAADAMSVVLEAATAVPQDDGVKPNHEETFCVKVAWRSQ